MCKRRAAQSSRRDSSSPESEVQPHTHTCDGDDVVLEQDSSGLPPDVPQSCLQLQPPPAASSLPDPNALTVWMGDQYVGNPMLDFPLDLSNVPVPANHSPAIGSKAQLTMPPPIPSLRVLSQANNSPAEAKKRKAGERKPSESNKRPKRVARNARPVARKPASAYAKAVEEPKGMTKNEEDSCLTCIKYNRRCGGTQLHMVKGAKRWKNCAFPGKGSCGRVCYWPDKKEVILTYEDGVRLLAERLGGRTLTKNTRKGRLERQGDADEDTSDSDSEDEPEGGEVDDLGDEEEVHARDEVESMADSGDTQLNDDGLEYFDDPDMVSVATAHQDRYHTIGSYLGFPEDTHTTIMQLDIHRVMRGGFGGSGSISKRRRGYPRLSSWSIGKIGDYDHRGSRANLEGKNLPKRWLLHGGRLLCFNSDRELT